MTILLATHEGPQASSRGKLSPPVARTLLAVVMAAAAIAGALVTDTDAARMAVAASGPDLTRLLRLMMLLKAGMAAAACRAVLWRLGWSVSAGWFAAYAVAAVAMVGGPGLIWGMAHVKLGALLLHAGLAASVLLLWRDPVVARALGEVVRRRVARRKAAASPRVPRSP